MLLSGVVVWWWLSVNAFCSWVVQCWYILPNMLVVEYCSFTPEFSFIEFCLFTVSFVRFCSAGAPGPCAPLLRSINSPLECYFDSLSILLLVLKSL